MRRIVYRMLFRMLDPDRSGTIDFHELKMSLSRPADNSAPSAAALSVRRAAVSGAVRIVSK